MEQLLCKVHGVIDDEIEDFGHLIAVWWASDTCYFSWMDCLLRVDWTASSPKTQSHLQCDWLASVVIATQYLVDNHFDNFHNGSSEMAVDWLDVVIQSTSDWIQFNSLQFNLNQLNFNTIELYFKSIQLKYNLKLIKFDTIQNQYNSNTI